MVEGDSKNSTIGGTEAHSFNQKLELWQSIFVLYFESKILEEKEMSKRMNINPLYIYS